jgi:hypothetical protein
MFEVFTNLFVANPDRPLFLSDLLPYWSVPTAAQYPISFCQSVHIIIQQRPRVVRSVWVLFPLMAFDVAINQADLQSFFLISKMAEIISK